MHHHIRTLGRWRFTGDPLVNVAGLADHDAGRVSSIRSP
jgi:hypothetical protein